MQRKCRELPALDYIQNGLKRCRERAEDCYVWVKSERSETLQRTRRELLRLTITSFSTACQYRRSFLNARLGTLRTARKRLGVLGDAQTRLETLRNSRTNCSLWGRNVNKRTMRCVSTLTRPLSRKVKLARASARDTLLSGTFARVNGGLRAINSFVVSATRNTPGVVTTAKWEKRTSALRAGRNGIGGGWKRARLPNRQGIPARIAVL